MPGKCGLPLGLPSWNELPFCSVGLLCLGSPKWTRLVPGPWLAPWCFCSVSHEDSSMVIWCPQSSALIHDKTNFLKRNCVLNQAVFHERPLSYISDSQPECRCTLCNINTSKESQISNFSHTTRCSHGRELVRAYKAQGLLCLFKWMHRKILVVLQKNPQEKYIVSLPSSTEARASCCMLPYKHMWRGDILFQQVLSPGLSSVKINNNVWLGLLTKSYRTRTRDYRWNWQRSGVRHNRKHFLTWWGSNCWSLLSREAVQADNVSKLRKALDIFMGSKSIETYLKGQGRDVLSGISNPTVIDAGWMQVEQTAESSRAHVLSLNSHCIAAARDRALGEMDCQSDPLLMILCI